MTGAGDSAERPAAARFRVLCYGAPVRDLATALGPLLPRDTEITLLGYDAPVAGTEAAMAEADVILTNRFHRGLPAGPGLKLIQLPGAGHDEIDFGAIPAGVPVCNVYEHEIAVAEFVLMSMLDHQNRHLAEAERQFRSGSWEASGRFNGPRGGELCGKTLGIVGLGRIGQAVGRLAHGFGMRVLAATRTPPQPPPSFVAAVHPIADLLAMLPDCDIVLASCALSPETRGLLGASEFAAMRPDAYLVNISRGPVVDEGALYDALRNGRIGGAHIDVWYRYPDSLDAPCPPADHDFAALGNLRMTPHIAGWTDGTVARRIEVIAANIRAALTGGALRNRIESG